MLTKKMICGSCNNETFVLEASKEGTIFYEIRLQCINCKSVSYWKPKATIAMEWTGSGPPVPQFNK